MDSRKHGVDDGLGIADLRVAREGCQKCFTGATDFCGTTVFRQEAEDSFSVNHFPTLDTPECRVGFAECGAHLANQTCVGSGQVFVDNVWNFQLQGRLPRRGQHCGKNLEGVVRHGR